MRINKQDTEGTKPLLSKGELGYDDYTAGGDTGRVYVGTSTENILLAKKTEVDSKAEQSNTIYRIELLEDFDLVPGTSTVVFVADLKRGGTFVSKSVIEIDPNTGSLYAVNNVTVFAKLGGGFWAREYKGNIQLSWAGAISYKTKAEAIAGIDSYFAFENCIKALYPKGGKIEMPTGYVKTLSTIRDDIYNTAVNGYTIQLIGQGASEVDGEGSTILTQGAIVGIQFDGSRSGGKDFKLEGDNGTFDGISHGIVSNASRAQWNNILSIKNRGDGFLFRFGNNSNFFNITCLSNKGNGFNADGTGYVAKNGTPRPNDLNASVFVNIDSRANSLVGFRTGVNSGFSNFINGLTIQGNGGVGLEINGDYYRIFGFYGESNDSAGTNKDIRFSSTADLNRIYGIYSAVAPAWEDLSTNKRNYIDSYSFQSDNVHTQNIFIGEDTSPNGYIKFSGTGNGTNPSMTLEATSGTQQIDIKSSGAGKLGINPDFITRETIIAPTLLNSWINYGGARRVAGYWKDKEGMVHLEGVIKSGTTTSPTILFTLPTGYRPSNREKFATVSNGAFASLFVDSDGNVYYESGSNVEYSLCGISFRV